MPAAVSGNAVASLKGGFELFSLMGVGPKKTWDDVTNQVYIMTLTHTGKWSRAAPFPVPGPSECSRWWSQGIGRSHGWIRRG